MPGALAFPRIPDAWAGRHSAGWSPCLLTPRAVPCLSCRNPRKGRRTARASKPPPLSGRSVSERGWRSDSGDSDHPHLFSQPSSACQPHGLPRAASGGTGRNICVLEDRASASWNPLQSLPRLRGGDALSTTQVGALPSPCRFWELGRQREAWSQSWLLPHLPAPAHL